MTVRGVLFDVGNVIVRWDPRTLYSKVFPDPAERDRFLAEVCTMDWHEAHDRGASMDDSVAALAARHPDHTEAIRAWRHRWDEMLSGIIPETEAAILDLHARGVPLYALTNMSHEWAAPIFAMSPAFGCFRDIVVSAREGVIKPDPRIFEIACERAALTPRELLFVDDGLANIEAAERLGFAVHRFDDPAALRPALEAYGLL